MLCIRGGWKGPGNMTLAVCSVVDRSSHSGPRAAMAEVDVGGSLIPNAAILMPPSIQQVLLRFWVSKKAVCKSQT